jgi:hypothetical protein
MSRCMIVGFLIVCTVMASHVLVALGADATYFQAMHLTWLDQAVALPDI